jgi:hypothetical protein
MVTTIFSSLTSKVGIVPERGVEGREDKKQQNHTVIDKRFKIKAPEREY